MKTLLQAVAFAALPAALLAADLNDIDPAELVRAIERITGWTQEELSGGLRNIDNLYSRDMASESGRVHWHGPLQYSEILTNLAIRVDHYEDGWTNCVPFTPPRPYTPATNGIPARLAAARLRAWRESQTTNSVTIEVTGNAPEGH